MKKIFNQKNKFFQNTVSEHIDEFFPIKIVDTGGKFGTGINPQHRPAVPVTKFAAVVVDTSSAP
jgi:hypothetical protein